MKKILLLFTCVYVTQANGRSKVCNLPPVYQAPQAAQESKPLLLSEMPLDLTLTTASPIRPARRTQLPPTLDNTTNQEIIDNIMDQHVKEKVEQALHEERAKCKLDEILMNQRIIIMLLGALAAKLVIYDLYIANQEK